MQKPTRNHRRERGGVLILSMIFLAIFSALAVALAATSGANVQMASNQQHGNGAFHAACSGLECAKYIVSTVTLDETYSNMVTVAQANKAWLDLCTYIQSTAMDGKTVPAPSRFADSFGQGDQIVTQSLGFGVADAQFTIRFSRYDADPHTIKTTSFGTHGNAARRVGIDMDVTKDRKVLEYGLASRGRIWLTGDTTIHGDIFSTWDRAGISPFNMTSDSAVHGTVNTVRTLSQIQNDTFQLETLNGDGVPLDIYGDPLADNYDERYYGPGDEIQGYHEGVNYGQPYNDMPGMDISDYNTDLYTPGLTTIPAIPTGDRITEYFPHAAGNYTRPRDGGSTSFTRHVYENQTFTNALLPANRHALFRNCTFQDVLYIDTSKSSASKQYANNVRFENCTFNGVIVTDVPQPFNWKNNCLYFTGSATFDNQSSVQEATVLAPHFNVNLGNANPQQSDHNRLRGVIVGGIVDVRGNAQVNGTIISMADTTMYTSGYVTNIGATLDDGGSETTEVGDVGVIRVKPQKDTMLPSGISSPIVIKPDPTTYVED